MTTTIRDHLSAVRRAQTTVEQINREHPGLLLAIVKRDRPELFVAATPEPIDTTARRLHEVLTDPDIPEVERSRLRQIVQLVLGGVGSER